MKGRQGVQRSADVLPPAIADVLRAAGELAGRRSSQNNYYTFIIPLLYPVLYLPTIPLLTPYYTCYYTPYYISRYTQTRAHPG